MIRCDIIGFGGGGWHEKLRGFFAQEESTSTEPAPEIISGSLFIQREIQSKTEV